MNALFSFYKAKDDRSLTAAFCIIFSYTLLKPFKLSILSHIAPITLIARGQFITFLIINFSFLFLYKKIATTCPLLLLKRTLFVSSAISISGGAAIGFIFNYNSLRTHALGWLLYFSLEIILLASLNFFWNWAHDFNNKAQNTLSYSALIFYGQLGGIFGGWCSLLIPSAISYGGHFCLFFLAALSFYGVFINLPPLIPAINFPSTEASSTLPALESQNAIMRILLGSTIFHEVTRVSLDYAFLNSVQKVSSKAADVHSMLSAYEVSVQTIAFLFLLATSYYEKKALCNVRSMSYVPLLSFSCIITCSLLHSRLSDPINILLCLTAIQALFLGFHYPASKKTASLLTPQNRIFIGSIRSLCGRPSGKITGLVLGFLMPDFSLQKALLIPLGATLLWIFSSIPYAKKNSALMQHE